LVVAAAVVGCSNTPSKSEALQAIQNAVKEDGSCILPVEILSHLKMQHATKGICVPKEGADKARACVDALVTAGITQRKPDAYMLTWPDEVAGASLEDVPAYERHARNLLYGTCVELVGNLREGRFPCARVHADKILKIASLDATHAGVRYERAIEESPTLAPIDAACGTTTRPPGEASVQFAKSASGWALAPTAEAGTDGGSR
jgi:hypothetical protein